MNAWHGNHATLWMIALWMTFAGCAEDPATSGDSNTLYSAELADTLLMGMADNAEVIVWVPGADRALLVSSKARKLTLLAVHEGALQIVAEAALFPEDSSESELTNAAVSSDGSWAVLTRTLLLTDSEGAQTACEGELVFVGLTPDGTFGDILSTISVGAMPDSVAISDDDAWVASADERDGPDAWGKCEVPGTEASISIVDLSAGPSAPALAGKLWMVDGDTGPREPEDLCFSADGERILVTLQDSHEIAILPLADVVTGATSTSETMTLIALPPNALGALPWPDGITRFNDMNGEEHFAVAGEWNDTILLLDAAGDVITNLPIALGDIPEMLPRVEDEGSPRFSPDSLTTFVHDGRTHIAVTLRHSGAIAIWDVSDPIAPVFCMAVGVGKTEAGADDENGSTIRPEGITASPHGEWLLTANEGESSVSLVRSLAGN